MNNNGLSYNSRTKEFDWDRAGRDKRVTKTRFSFEEAVQIAEELLPTLKCMHRNLDEMIATHNVNN